MARPNTTALAAGVPVYPLQATKFIRWKASTIFGDGEPVFDAAPNEAMFE